MPRKTSIEHLGPAYLQCRARSHPWDHWNDTGFVIRRRLIVAFTHVERCLRCGRFRWETLNAPEMTRTPDCAGWHYNQLPDYALDQRYSRADFLAEIHRRHGGFNTHEDRTDPEPTLLPHERQTSHA